MNEDTIYIIPSTLFLLRLLHSPSVTTEPKLIPIQYAITTSPTPENMINQPHIMIHPLQVRSIENALENAEDVTAATTAAAAENGELSSKAPRLKLLVRVPSRSCFLRSRRRSISDTKDVSWNRVFLNEL